VEDGHPVELAVEGRGEAGMAMAEDGHPVTRGQVEITPALAVEEIRPLTLDQGQAPMRIGPDEVSLLEKAVVLHASPKPRAAARQGVAQRMRGPAVGEDDLADASLERAPRSEELLFHPAPGRGQAALDLVPRHRRDHALRTVRVLQESRRFEEKNELLRAQRRQTMPRRRYRY
jgi:hypothetical protein